MKNLLFIVVFSYLSLLVQHPALANDSGVGGINHTGLTVLDLNATENFFTSVLGFSVSGRDKSYPSSFLSNGEAFITLWQVSDPKKAIKFDRKNNVGLHHIAFTMESFEALDALHEKLKTVPGVKIEFAPETLGNGPTEHMMIREPSGNRLEFIHRSKIGRIKK